MLTKGCRVWDVSVALSDLGLISVGCMEDLNAFHVSHDGH